MKKGTHIIECQSLIQQWEAGWIVVCVWGHVDELYTKHIQALCRSVPR